MKKKFETKTLKLDVKELSETGTFEGYASTRSKDLGGDMIAEGMGFRPEEMGWADCGVRTEQPTGLRRQGVAACESANYEL